MKKRLAEGGTEAVGSSPAELDALMADGTIAGGMIPKVESCVHAVERYVRRGHDLVDAIRLAYDDLEGDYAFVIGRADDDRHVRGDDRADAPPHPRARAARGAG